MIFRNLLNNLEEWCLAPNLFQFNNQLQLLNNQLCQDSTISFFWKGEYGAIKNDKYQLLKMTRSGYIAILIKS